MLVELLDEGVESLTLKKSTLLLLQTWIMLSERLASIMVLANEKSIYSLFHITDLAELGASALKDSGKPVLSSCCAYYFSFTY